MLQVETQQRMKEKRSEWQLQEKREHSDWLRQEEQEHVLEQPEDVCGFCGTLSLSLSLQHSQYRTGSVVGSRKGYVYTNVGRVALIF